MNKLYDFHCAVSTNTDRVISFEITQLTKEEYVLIRNQLEFIFDKFIKVNHYTTLSFICPHYEKKKLQ